MNKLKTTGQHPSNKRFIVHHGDVEEVLKDQQPSQYDASFTDPPYGISYGGLKWDNAVPGVSAWEQVLRVTKPGGYLLAFGSPRTWHRLTANIEDAGWEIQSCISWMYGSGCPRGRKLDPAGPQWLGYATGLKPAWEPIVVARKPTPLTLVCNAIKHGCGGLNIDGCRVGKGGGTTRSRKATVKPGRCEYYVQSLDAGRWPANVIVTDGIAKELPPYFFTLKATTERKESDHPTQKPLDLCEYLARLVLPPQRETPRRLLVPFAGSGSEMLGGLVAGWDHVTGIEIDRHWVSVARRRLSAFIRSANCA